MKLRVATSLGMVLLAACASTKPVITSDAVEDFIIANQLEPQDRVRTRGERDGWVALNNRFVVYKSRRKNFLLEFRRECRALTNTYAKAPDLRLDQGSLRARTDTLRGCMISHIYVLTRDQAVEVKQLGDAPGSKT